MEGGLVGAVLAPHTREEGDLGACGHPAQLGFDVVVLVVSKTHAFGLGECFLALNDFVWVEHHQDFYLAEVVGRDAIANIALLKLKDKKPSEFSFLRVTELPVLPRPGTFVVTLSAPLQFPPSPAMGVVQGHESNFGNRMFPARMLRTSVSVGPGEVGAPMLDLNGRFIGMVFASLPDLRSSCVLPASAVLRVRDDLLFSGKVSYAWFGLTVTSMIVEGGLRVQVDKILVDSPVAGSGIRKGDLLLKIGDHQQTKRLGDDIVV